jgi:alkylation response protein AidB-like acyl-CoA dehydrogenase
MDFQLNEEQQALVSAVQTILQDHAELPQSARLQTHFFDHALQELLGSTGFLNVGRELGTLAAALVIIEAARIPAVIEVTGQALILAQLVGDERLRGPVALLSERDLPKAHRNLPIARTALIDVGEDVAIVDVEPANVRSVESIYAYPYGRFVQMPDLRAARRLPGRGAKLRQWWRVGLAAEIAGAAQSAVSFTISHVKQRHVFGHPVGAFQSVQHRLVQCHLVATGTHYLALRAAWSGEAYHADLAACYAQQHVQKLLVDLHQFTGAMGITNEFLLHFWTYRLRALQSEAGGMIEAALSAAGSRWKPTEVSRAPQIAGADTSASPR